MLSATKLRRTVVVLFQGDDYDRMEELAAEVRAAEANAMIADTSVARMGDGDEDAAQDKANVKAKAADYDAFMVEAVERGQSVTVEALPRRAFRELVVANPPRPDNDADAAWGFDYEALADPLVPACLPLVDRETGTPQFGSEADRQEFVDSLSDGDFSRLYSAAIKVNQGGAPDPKVSLSQRLDPTSAASSEPPPLRD